MSAKMRAWGKTFGDRMAANPKRLAANRRNATDSVWLAERRATAKRVGSTPKFREACRAGALRRRMKPKSKTKPVVSTRPAPRGQTFRPKLARPSHYDKVHPKFIALHDTPERQQRANELLRMAIGLPPVAPIQDTRNG